MLIGLDEIAKTRHGVIPKPAHGIPQHAFLVAAQIDFHFHEACTELTALDHAACHNILRWGVWIANRGDVPAVLHVRFECQDPNL